MAFMKGNTSASTALKVFEILHTRSKLRVAFDNLLQQDQRFDGECDHVLLSISAQARLNLLCMSAIFCRHSKGYIASVEPVSLDTPSGSDF